MVLHTSLMHHFDKVSIPGLCSYPIKVILVIFENSVVQFDSTKHRRFSSSTPVNYFLL